MTSNRATRPTSWLALLALVLAAAGCPPRPVGQEMPVPELAKTPLEQWVPLFDGKTLRGWRIVEKWEFELHGKIEVKDGALCMAKGMPFSAIAWDGEVPKENFEVEVEAKRTDGGDIFCGLTLPVGSSHVSLFCGGWGNTVTGISSIDDLNASENETTAIIEYENNRWYRIRARVTEEAILAWVDDKQVIEVERKGRRFSLYGGVEPTGPLGLFTWQTGTAVRSIRFRRLPGTPKAPPKALPALPEGNWQSLFDGKSLGGWGVGEADEFALHGKVTPGDGEIRLAAGDPMTGVAWDRKFPTIGYELALDALREEGSDFFVGLTFPVAKAHCTLILGGWGGNIVGLSNIDDLHAAENETTQSIHFTNGEWYRVRLRVTAERIKVWLDGKEIINLAHKGRKLTIWPQQEPMRPLGIASYYTTTRVRNIQYRTLAGT